MADKYLRFVRASFFGSGGATLVVEKLKVAFSVQKSISGVPNSGTVEIWNLSAEHRNAVGKEFDRVQLEAGYEGSGTGIILIGAIREVFHERQDVDIVSRVAVGDGDLNDRTGRVAKSYPAGTKIREIVEDIQGHMPDVALGELKGLDDLPPLRRPLTIVSSTRQAMDDLGRSHGFHWSVQNEALETIPADGFLNQRTLITPQTGMIGVPTITDRGVNVQVMLDPSIRPNRLIEVHSETLDMNGEKSGTYRVNSVAFRGDNMDGDFLAEVEGERVQNGKVTG